MQQQGESSVLSLRPGGGGGDGGSRLFVPRFRSSDILSDLTNAGAGETPFVVKLNIQIHQSSVFLSLFNFWFHGFSLISRYFELYNWGSEESLDLLLILMIGFRFWFRFLIWMLCLVMRPYCKRNQHICSVLSSWCFFFFFILCNCRQEIRVVNVCGLPENSCFSWERYKSWFSNS